MLLQKSEECYINSLSVSAKGDYVTHSEDNTELSDSKNNQFRPV